MTTIERGMVIDINLDPVQGSETGKVGPCVVVTNDVYNAPSCHPGCSGNSLESKESTNQNQCGSYSVCDQRT
jgi:hypothetical protein